MASNIKYTMYSIHVTNEQKYQIKCKIKGIAVEQGGTVVQFKAGRKKAREFLVVLCWQCPSSESHCDNIFGSLTVMHT